MYHLIPEFEPVTVLQVFHNLNKSPEQLVIVSPAATL